MSPILIYAATQVELIVFSCNYKSIFSPYSTQPCLCWNQNSLVNINIYIWLAFVDRCPLEGHFSLYWQLSNSDYLHCITLIITSNIYKRLSLRYLVYKRYHTIVMFTIGWVKERWCGLSNITSVSAVCLGKNLCPVCNVQSSFRAPLYVKTKIRNNT